MHLFTRSARLGPGNPVEQAAWAISITEKVNQISELEVSLWSRVFSPGLGTLVWTSVVEELASLEATEAKLMADSGYLSLIEQGEKYNSGEGIDDHLVSLIHPDPDAANVQATHASVVQAVAAPGNFVRAIELGVEIALEAKRITGCPTSFGVASTGTYGGVEWITMYSSIEQLQKAEQDLNSDASFAARIDKDASKAYLPGVAEQTLFRKIV